MQINDMCKTANKYILNLWTLN